MTASDSVDKRAVLLFGSPLDERAMSTWPNTFTFFKTKGIEA
jgi:hypothetical protein